MTPDRHKTKAGKRRKAIERLTLAAVEAAKHARNEAQELAAFRLLCQRVTEEVEG